MTMPKSASLQQSASSSNSKAADGQSRAAKLAALRIRYSSIPAGRTLTVEEASVELKRNELVNFDASARTLSLHAMRSLTESLAMNRSLKILNLWGCGMGEAGAEMLCAWLGSARCLEGIDLRHNQLGPGGVGHVARALSTNTSLFHVSLGSNGARKQGLAELANGLARAGDRSRLAVLDFDSNGIGVAGGSLAAKILSASSSLVHLNVSYNELGDKGLADLVPGLVASTSLASLSLRHVGLSHIGASIFADVVASVTLASVDISENCIGEDGAEIICAAIDRSESITAMVADAIGDDLMTAEIHKKIAARREARNNNAPACATRRQPQQHQLYRPTSSPYSKHLSSPSGSGGTSRSACWVTPTNATDMFLLSHRPQHLPSSSPTQSSSPASITTSASC